MFIVDQHGRGCTRVVTVRSKYESWDLARTLARAKNTTPRINMYADTELHYCCSHLQEVERVLQNELERVSNWMVVNRLKLNINKSMCMLIGSRQRVGRNTLCLSLNGSLLKQISSTLRCV